MAHWLSNQLTKNVVEHQLNVTCGKSSLTLTASTEQTNIQHTSQLRSFHTSFQFENCGKLPSADGATAAEPPCSTISDPVNVEYSSLDTLFGHRVSTQQRLIIDFTSKRIKGHMTLLGWVTWRTKYAWCVLMDRLSDPVVDSDTGRSLVQTKDWMKWWSHWLPAGTKYSVLDLEFRPPNGSHQYLPKWIYSLAIDLCSWHTFPRHPPNILNWWLGYHQVLFFTYRTAADSHSVRIQMVIQRRRQQSSSKPVAITDKSINCSVNINR